MMEYGRDPRRESSYADPNFVDKATPQSPSNRERISRLSEADLRRRVLPVTREEIHALHGGHNEPGTPRPSHAVAKEAGFESLDYDIIESNLHLSSQRNQTNSYSRRFQVGAMRWLLTGLAGMVTAMVAFGINVGIHYLNQLKFGLTYNLIQRGLDSPSTWEHLGRPLLMFVGINLGYVLVATLLVSCVEPVARGSGIPEVKCYLNGVKIPRVVRVLTVICKATGVLFSVAGGLPVGKEGPMIHSGAVVAAGMSQGKSSSLGVDTSWTKFKAFRNDKEKRDFVASGAAAGVAAAFGAPVGGVLFALEEGATHWNTFLTWRTFVCAMVCGFFLDLFQSGFNDGAGDWSKFGQMNQQGMVTFGSFEGQDKSYPLIDLILMALLGVIGGLVGAAFNHANTHLTIWRKRVVVPSTRRNILEALAVAATCALIAFLVPYWAKTCVDKKNFVSVGDEDLMLATQFYCNQKGASNPKQGPQVDEVALLFFQPSEATIKMLFHSQADFSYTSLGGFTIIYVMLACWTYGIAVPSGLFVPSLLSGAAMGRLYGKAAGPDGLGIATAHAGVYALIGAAAFLGGMSRMTISLTVILIEACNDYSYGLPLMVTLIIARWVGNLFNEGLYDIHIELNHVPMITEEAVLGPWEQNRAVDVLLARDVMAQPPRSLHEVEKVSTVVQLLMSTTHNAFPVIDDGTIMGHDGSLRIANDDPLPDGRPRSTFVGGKGGAGTLQSSSAASVERPVTRPVTMGGLEGAAPPMAMGAAARDCLLLASPAVTWRPPPALNKRQRTYCGMITRRQLCAMLDKRVFGPKTDISWDVLGNTYPHYPSIRTIAPTLTNTDLGQLLCLGPFMTSGAYTIASNAPLARVLHLFRPMGLRHLPVTDKFNNAIGVITRKDLVAHALVESLVASQAKAKGSQGSEDDVYVAPTAPLLGTGNARNLQQHEGL